MIKHKFFPFAIAVIFASMSMAETAPFACNLKALNPAARARLHELGQRLFPAAEGVTELKDGYALRIDPAKFTFTEAAEWATLERKCCPFFFFSLDLPAGANDFRVTLSGKEGVKQFITSEFPAVRNKVDK